MEEIYQKLSLEDFQEEIKSKGNFGSNNFPVRIFKMLLYTSLHPEHERTIGCFWDSNGECFFSNTSIIAMFCGKKQNSIATDFRCYGFTMMTKKNHEQNQEFDEKIELLSRDWKIRINKTYRFNKSCSLYDIQQISWSEKPKNEGNKTQFSQNSFFNSSNHESYLEISILDPLKCESLCLSNLKCQGQSDISLFSLKGHNYINEEERKNRFISFLESGTTFPSYSIQIILNFFPYPNLNLNKLKSIEQFISIYGKGIHCLNLILELVKNENRPKWLIPFWKCQDPSFSMPKLQKFKWFAVEIGKNNVAFQIYYGDNSNSAPLIPHDVKYFYDIKKDSKSISMYSIVNLGYGNYSIFNGYPFSNSPQLCLPSQSILELLSNINLDENNAMLLDI